jgi:hypothetical protein
MQESGKHDPDCSIYADGRCDCCNRDDTSDSDVDEAEQKKAERNLLIGFRSDGGLDRDCDKSSVTPISEPPKQMQACGCKSLLQKATAEYPRYTGPGEENPAAINRKTASRLFSCARVPR